MDSEQLELFSQQKENYAGQKETNSRYSLFGYVRGYEKVIITIISFVTFGIITFSLGVERGKSLNIVKSPQEIPLPQQNVAAAVVTKAPVAKEVSAVTPVVQAQVTQKETIVGGYTVQIASYKLKESARKEAELLKKKGLSPIIISKGKYTVLCVGNFPDRKSAESFLAEIGKNKRYQGSTIRRL